MRTHRLLARRRRAGPPAATGHAALVHAATGRGGSRRAAATLALAVLLSLVLHGGVAALVPGNGGTSRRSETVVRIVNDAAEPAPDEARDEPPPEEEQIILDPPPEEEETAEQSPAPDGLVEEGTFIDDQVPDLADLEAPEEVFGIDLADAVDRGALAVRIGNTLAVRPGRFVDPSQVKQRWHTRRVTEPKAPPTPREHELPEMPAQPDRPRFELPQRPATPVRPPPPPKAVTRVVPKEKFRDRFKPEYTDEALDAEVEGIVEIDLWIAPDGHPTKASVVHGLGYGLDERVTQAALRSTFNPVLADGRPVACKYRLRYRFEMQW